MQTELPEQLLLRRGEFGEGVRMNDGLQLLLEVASDRVLRPGRGQKVNRMVLKLML